MLVVVVVPAAALKRVGKALSWASWSQRPAGARPMIGMIDRALGWGVDESSGRLVLDFSRAGEELTLVVEAGPPHEHAPRGNMQRGAAGRALQSERRAAVANPPLLSFFLHG